MASFDYGGSDFDTEVQLPTFVGQLMKPSAVHSKAFYIQFSIGMMQIKVKLVTLQVDRCSLLEICSMGSAVVYVCVVRVVNVDCFLQV